MRSRMMALAVAVMVAAMGVPRGVTHGAGLDLVRVGGIGLILDAGLYVAMERGYFREAGIRVEVQTFTGTPKMVPAMVAGELDVIGGPAVASLFNAFAAGMDFKVVADMGQSRPGHEFLTLVVRKDLLDSGALRSLADLKGRKIGHLPGQGVTSQYVLWRALEHAGIPWGAVQRVDISAPNQLTLLADKQVDAVVTGEPFGSRAERAGVGVRYPLSAEVKALERLQVALIMYAGRFMASRNDLARRWMHAYVKGLRFLHEKGMKSDVVIGMLTKHVRATAEDIRESWPPYLAPDGRPDVTSLAAQQDWYARMGFVEKTVPLEKVVDLRFLP